MPRRRRLNLSLRKWQDRTQLDSKYCAQTSSGAFRTNRSAVKLDNCFRNRQAKTQAAARLHSSDIALLKGSENKRERFLTDPNAIVAHCYNKLSRAGIRRAHGDLAARGRELDCVLEQVPEYLINSGVVTSDMMLVGRQFEAEH